MLQIRNARRELKTEQGKEREDVFRIDAAVGVVAANRDIAGDTGGRRGYAEPRSPSLQSMIVYTFLSDKN